MPKLKRPIVPVRKPVDHGKSRTCNHPTKPSKSGRPTEAGSNFQFGGGHGKRPREGDAQDAKVSNNKRRKKHAAPASNNASRRDRGVSSGLWRPLSIVHQQAALAVQRLLEADSSRQHGASLKSLTLAPHVEAKKATFAVTCQVLKCKPPVPGARFTRATTARPAPTGGASPASARFLPVLQFSTAWWPRAPPPPSTVTPPIPVPSYSVQLGKYVAMVLSYELLRGQGLTRKGPAERAVIAAEPKLRAALEDLLRQEGVQSLDDLLAVQQQRQHGGAGPDVPHPRWVRVNTLKADVDDVVRQLDEHLRGETGTEQEAQQVAGKEQRKQQQVSRLKKQPRQEELQQQQQQEEEEEEELQRAVVKQPRQEELQQQEEPQQQQEEEEEPQRAVVVRDALLPGELLALPPGTDLHDHPLVTRGSVVLQSKASCMPARALAPEPGWTVVDCCAAPGNKTTHLAAILGNKGRVLAFDKDPRRLARLRANAALTGSSCIEARLADFLTIDPTAPEYRQVRGVLLDPSCSGSGTTFTRMDHLLPSHHHQHTATAPEAATGAATGAAAARQPAATTATTATVPATRQPAAPDTEAPSGLGSKSQGKKQKNIRELQDQEQEQEGGGAAAAASPDLDTGLPVQDTGLDAEEAARVAQLARFQAAALSHALRFPSLERLVYSTCSVHVAENEAVVAGALQQAAEAGMELADPFPGWHRRGLPLFPGAEKLVRTDAYQDGTDGFFVAMFQRRREQGQQQQPEQEVGEPQRRAKPRRGKKPQTQQPQPQPQPQQQRQQQRSGAPADGAVGGPRGQEVAGSSGGDDGSGEHDGADGAAVDVGPVQQQRAEGGDSEDGDDGAAAAAAEAETAGKEARKEVGKEGRRRGDAGDGPAGGSSKRKGGPPGGAPGAGEEAGAGHKRARPAGKAVVGRSGGGGGGGGGAASGKGASARRKASGSE
ncbi:hypothetical protein PLESTF_001731700 [Pleodorina starrii]|nr:hypothetical protein PLESTF_001731700 [Pleodorina starrii]